MNNFKNKIAFVAYVLVGVLIGTIIGLYLIHFLIGLNNNDINIIKAISFLFVGFAAIAGIFQLSINARQAKHNTKQIKYSNEWNKKQLATTRLHESEKNIKAALTALHSTLNVVGRDIEKPYEDYEIHNVLGVFLNDKKTFIFHGEQTENEIKQLPKNSNEQKDNHLNSFNNNINGRVIRDNIIALLNEYEYISSSVNCDIFDKESVMRLIDLKLVRTYLRFEIYIKHLRKEHGGGSTTYKELEDFAKEIMKIKKIKNAKDLKNL